MIFNIIKTITLLAVLSGLLLFIGGFIGGSNGIYFALIFSLIMNTVAYFFSDQIVLNMYRAQPLDTTQYDWIYRLVRNLTHTMQLPMPKLWLLPTPSANAFATGRNPQNASIAITQPIISLLDHDELRGVLAHELSHVKNRDTLVTTVAATIATAIGRLAYMLQYLTFWESPSGDKQRRRPLSTLIVIIFMPLAATLLQLAVSRSREYLADETSAYYSRDPLSLASALKKLHDQNSQKPPIAEAVQYVSTSSLFIVQSFTSNTWFSLFSTHPPVKKRIMRLRAIYEKMFS